MTHKSKKMIHLLL